VTQQILGIDEVGRGPWAGPLVVGAVILGTKFQELDIYTELRDSKKIAKAKRIQLAESINKNALAHALGWVKADEIDQFGLGPALKLAARRAVKQILAQKIKFDNIVIDGTINLLADTPLEERVTLLPKADNLVKEVSAASIIAKVARDQYMVKLGEKYPLYGFEKHVGYGTALESYGICPEHRQSFRPIAKIIEAHGDQQLESNSTQKECEIGRAEPIRTKKGRQNYESGHRAEDVAVDYLREQNHQIIARNCKTTRYEIDIISQLNGEIYFSEVKYRKNTKNGDPLEQITPAKLKQMRYAAEKFLQAHPEFRDLQPILAAIGVSGKNFSVDGLKPCC